MMSMSEDRMGRTNAIASLGEKHGSESKGSYSQRLEIWTRV